MVSSAQQIRSHRCIARGSLDYSKVNNLGPWRASTLHMLKVEVDTVTRLYACLSRRRSIERLRSLRPDLGLHRLIYISKCHSTKCDAVDYCDDCDDCDLEQAVSSGNAWPCGYRSSVQDTLDDSGLDKGWPNRYARHLVRYVLLFATLH